MEGRVQATDCNSTTAAMSAKLSWDEFRLVKAIADSRSLAGAAELLGLNHSTVFRRLAALETAIGARLFERSRSGYQPTTAGYEMIALATTMATSIVEFERRVAGRDAKPTGQLRVTTVEALGQHYLPAILAQFQGQNPGVAIELILSNQALDIVTPRCGRRHSPDQSPAGNPGGAANLRGAMGDVLSSRPCRRAWPADVRFRPVHWVRRKLRTDVGPAVDRNANPTGAAGRPGEFGPQHARADDSRVRGGAAALFPRRPCRWSGSDKPLGDVDLGLWILTHSDLRRSARVRAFMDFTSVELAKHRRTIEGAENGDSSGLARWRRLPFRQGHRDQLARKESTSRRSSPYIFPAPEFWNPHGFLAPRSAIDGAETIDLGVPCSGTLFISQSVSDHTGRKRMVDVGRPKVSLASRSRRSGFSQSAPCFSVGCRLASRLRFEFGTRPRMPQLRAGRSRCAERGAGHDRAAAASPGERDSVSLGRGGLVCFPPPTRLRRE